MNKTQILSSTFLSGVLVIGMYGSMAIAADIGVSQLPAVSAINGKLEVQGGFADANGISSDKLFVGAGSLSLPMGDMFGLQADFAAKQMFDDTMAGGALHLFTRDPNSYLVGAIGGYAASEGASTLWAGGETEWYMDAVSVELAAGYMNVNPKAGSNKDKLFGFADIAFYPLDNFRLSLGASSVANFESANVRAEYLLDAAPVSLSLKGQFGEDGYTAVTAGLSYYFGGDDSSKSLKRRHREDDPRNRVLDIFGSGGAAFGSGVNGRGKNRPGDPEAACLALGPFYIFDPETGSCFDESIR